jgi:hypothetical protein
MRYNVILVQSIGIMSLKPNMADMKSDKVTLESLRRRLGVRHEMHEMVWRKGSLWVEVVLPFANFREHFGMKRCQSFLIYTVKLDRLRFKPFAFWFRTCIITDMFL